MKKNYGKDWWDDKTSTPIKDKYNDRKSKEDMNPWHGKRGAHPIFYIDLVDLGKIININWPSFKDILPSQHWLKQRIDELSHSRNPVAHMNPISNRDYRRVELYVTDLMRHLKDKETLI